MLLSKLTSLADIVTSNVLFLTLKNLEYTDSPELIIFMFPVSSTVSYEFFAIMFKWYPIGFCVLGPAVALIFNGNEDNALRLLPSEFLTERVIVGAAYPCTVLFLDHESLP